MVFKLERIITDKNLAWDSSTIRPENYLCEFSPDAMVELKSTPLPNCYEEISSRLQAFPELQKDIETFYAHCLNKGEGFGIIQGLSPKDFNSSQQEMIYWMACNFLGTPLGQNAQGDIRYEVKDKGKKMETGGRYSETNQAGVLHTDSIQWERPPEIVGLLCLHPAMSGGESVIMSAYSLHNKLLKDYPDLLGVLYEPFPFETRKSTGEVQLINKPVFRYDEEKGLRFEYIGTYVPESPLSPKQKEAKKSLDAALEDPILTVNIGTLQAGEMQFLMNFRNAHGRKGDFINFPEPERERIMIRAWLREK